MDRPQAAQFSGARASHERWLTLLAIAGVHAALIAWLVHSGIVPRQKALDVLQAFLIVPQAVPPRVELPSPPRQEKRVQPRLPEPTPAPVLSAPAEAPAAITVPQPSVQPALTPAPAVEAAALSVTAPRFDAEYLHNPKPAYPVSSRRRGEEGRVVLRVHVSAEGRAAKVEVQDSSGHERLDESALAAVSRWRFVPARRGSEPLAAWVRVPIVFSLRD